MNRSMLLAIVIGIATSGLLPAVASGERFQAFERSARLFEAARVEYQYRDFEAAVALYEEAIALDPGFVEAMVNLAFTHAAAGRTDEARRWAARATAIRDDYPGTWALLGWLSLESGDAARAVDGLSRARALEPDDPRILSNLGVALHRAGHHKGARHALRRALRSSPEDPDAWLTLALAEEAMGDREAAVSAWRRFVASAPLAHPSAGIARARIRFLSMGGAPGAAARSRSPEPDPGLAYQERGHQ